MKPIEEGCKAIIIKAKTERGKGYIGTVVNVDRVLQKNEKFIFNGYELINDEPFVMCIISGNIISAGGMEGMAWID